MAPTIDEVVERARRRLVRVTPEQAAAELAQGALMVDTRTESQRAVQGEIPGAIVIDRTVLEWRLDPTSPSHIDEARDHRIRVIVVCAEGYSSSLAAASLQEIGLVNAADVIGGFDAHLVLGDVIGVAILISLGLAFAARVPRRILIFNGALVVLMIIQFVLAHTGVQVISALHIVNGVVIMGVSGFMTGQAWMLARGRERAAA